MHYYVATTYYSHAMELGNTELIGPFATEEILEADIEEKRQSDRWSLEEDVVTVLLLTAVNDHIVEGEVRDLVAPAFEMADTGDDDDFDHDFD